MLASAARSKNNRSLSAAGEHDFYVLLGAEERKPWTLSPSWKIALRTCIAVATLAVMAYAVVLIRPFESSNDVQIGGALLALIALVGALLWAATLDCCVVGYQLPSNDTRCSGPEWTV